MRLWLIIGAVLAGVVSCALGEPFTYQGRLDDGGVPAEGVYDLVFEAFAGPSGGTPLGVVSLEDVGVEGGVFTAELDFDVDGLPGGARWLQVRVRDGSSTGGYTVLSPRQAVTATPYAAVDLGEPWTREESGFLTYGADAGNRVVLINREERIGQEFFGIGANTSGFAGMYVSTTGAVGQPFYGYAAGENIDAYSYFDGAADRLLFNVRGADRFALDANGAEATGDLAVGGSLLTPVFRADAGSAEVVFGEQGDAVTVSTYGDSVHYGAGVYFGAVSASDYQYASDRSRSVSVGFAAFVGSVTTDAVLRDRSTGLATGEFGSGGSLLAPVSLPEGATITGMRVHALDNTGARGIRVALFRRSLASFTTQDSSVYGAYPGDVSGVRAATVPVVVGIPAEPTVQEGDTFFIEVSPTGGDWLGDVGLLSVRGVRVEYRVDRPD